MCSCIIFIFLHGFVIQTHASAWPFLKPVDKAEAPDYYDHIKFPMGKYFQCFDYSR